MLEGRLGIGSVLYSMVNSQNWKLRMDTDLEEFEDGGRIELAMQKQLEDSRKRRPDIQENGEK
jgi:hypothetical protein